MNGRIYDPLLGRFLSADTIVQFPGDLQSFNRYSYVQNNPLRFVDPTGFAVAPPPMTPPPAVVIGQRAAAAASQLDGPQPGPGDVAAVAILTGTMLIWDGIEIANVYEAKKQEQRTARELEETQQGIKERNKPLTTAPNPAEKKPLVASPHEVKLDPNSIQNSQSDTVKPNQPANQDSKEPKKDTGSNESKKDEKAKDSKDDKDAASKAASGKLRPLDNRDVKASNMHKFKEDFVGREDSGKYDAKVDENGQVVLVTKDGKTKVETTLTPEQVREEYPNEKDKDKRR